MILAEAASNGVAYIVQVQAAAWYVKFSDRLFSYP
jgi:hypothetical protein